MSQQASGTMQGKVKILSATDHQLIKGFSFDSDSVKRSDSGGLVFEGMMFPDDGSVVAIGLHFVDTNQSSGTFSYPDSKIKHFYFYPSHPDSLVVRSGEIVFQNHAPDIVRIDGKLTFSTEVKNLQYYKVEVIFNIEESD